MGTKKSTTRALFGTPSTLELEDWIDNYEIMTRYHVSQRTLQTLRRTGKLPYTIFANRCFYRKTDVQMVFRSRYRIRNDKKGK
jgi:hypothetical protein